MQPGFPQAKKMLKSQYMKKNVLILITLFLVCLLIYQSYFRKSESIFVLTEVYQGTISQEISETGQMKRGEEINLSFKTSGLIENIYVGVGEKVARGDILARLEKDQLEIQLKDAQAALSLSQAQLDKLLAGASIEEIQVAQTKIDNEEIGLGVAEQNLDDAYQDALNVLEDSFLKTYNAQNTVDIIQRSYFTGNNQQGIVIREEEEKIRVAVFQIKSFLDVTRESALDDDVERALSQVKDELAHISDGLKVIRETCELAASRDLVSSVDKTSLDTERDNINDVLTDVVDAQQTIMAEELAVITAQGELQKTKDDLSLLTAPARQEDITLYQAQLDQAKAKVELLEKQIEDTVLRSLVAGQITKKNKKIGEQVQASSSDSVFSLLPQEPFQIEVDIPEVDISNVELGNPCRITIDAFPEIEFEGEVIEIEPAETVISGVVYYKIKVNFDLEFEGVKPGMTANVVIITDSKENALIIPQRAITEKEGKRFVKVPFEKSFKEIEIEIGIKGTRGEIEVVSGLEQGDEIITFIKESD